MIPPHISALLDRFTFNYKGEVIQGLYPINEMLMIVFIGLHYSGIHTKNSQLGKQPRLISKKQVEIFA